MAEKFEDEKQKNSKSGEKEDSQWSNLSGIDTVDENEDNKVFWDFVQLLIVCHMNENDEIFPKVKTHLNDKAEDSQTVLSRSKAQAIGKKKSKDDQAKGLIG